MFNDKRSKKFHYKTLLQRKCFQTNWTGVFRFAVNLKIQDRKHVVNVSLVVCVYLQMFDNCRSSREYFFAFFALKVSPFMNGMMYFLYVGVG